jgi:predicted esterase
VVNFLAFWFILNKIHIDGGWPATGYNQLTDRAMEIVKKLITYYNADPNRIYVHGLSGGGQGAWNTLIYYPKLVAAAFPMSNLTMLNMLIRIIIGKNTFIFLFGFRRVAGIQTTCLAGKRKC